MLNQLGGDFVLMLDARQSQSLSDLRDLLERHDVLRLLVVSAPKVAPSEELAAMPRTTLVEDSEGLVASRYGLTRDVAYLWRPDQHVCARWRRLDPSRVEACLERALGAFLSTPEVHHASA